jgi:hypothetical protein
VALHLLFDLLAERRGLCFSKYMVLERLNFRQNDQLDSKSTLPQIYTLGLNKYFNLAQENTYVDLQQQIYLGHYI